jgi:hypothetical protein
MGRAVVLFKIDQAMKKVREPLLRLEERFYLIMAKEE